MLYKTARESSELGWFLSGLISSDVSKSLKLTNMVGEEKSKILDIQYGTHKVLSPKEIFLLN